MLSATGMLSDGNLSKRKEIACVLYIHAIRYEANFGVKVAKDAGCAVFLIF